MDKPIWIDVFLAPVRDNEIAQVAIVAVLLFILLDVVFGLLNALIHHEYSSQKMRDGIAHKCSELGFVLVGIIIDGTIIGGLDLGFSAPVLVAVCVYICLMELGSLLETLVKMNPALADTPLGRLLAPEKKDGGQDD